MQTLHIAVPAHVPASLIAEALARFDAVIVPKAKRAKVPREIPEPVIVRNWKTGATREIDGVTVRREIAKLMRKPRASFYDWADFASLPVGKGTAAYVAAWEAQKPDRR